MKYVENDHGIPTRTEIAFFLTEFFGAGRDMRNLTSVEYRTALRIINYRRAIYCGLYTDDLPSMFPVIRDKPAWDNK